MNKVARPKKNNKLVKHIEKQYGISLGYQSDRQLHTALKKDGLPSLSKLLRMIHGEPV